MAGKADPDLQKMVNELLPFKRGDYFSSVRLAEAIRRLQLTGKFKEIHVDTKEEHGEVLLLFDLTPQPRIKDIRIHGWYPLFKQDVLNAMTIYPGNAFVKSELEKQQSGIVELYKKEGFIDPKVHVTASQDPSDGNFVVDVRIEKGVFYQLADLSFSGNRSFSDLGLKWRMKSWSTILKPGSSRRFIEEDFKKDVQALIALYRKKGFAEVEIHPELRRDLKEHTVIASLEIREGPRYQILFSGNRAFWDFTLRKDLVIFKGGNQNNLGIRRSIRRLKERYRSSGYLQTRVEAEERPTPEGTGTVREIEMNIEEGPQSLVESMEIEGNAFLDERMIQNKMLTRGKGTFTKGLFVPSVFEEDIANIRAFYISEGFMRAEVKPDIQWNADQSLTNIRIQINEGVRTTVGSVQISGSNVLSTEEALNLIALKEGEPFRRYMIRGDEDTLSRIISAKGYPHVKVKGDVNLSEDGSLARVTYQVTDGIYVAMGSVYINGNLKTRDQVIENEMELEKGAAFSPEKMLLSQRNIRNMDIFRDVRFKTMGLEEEKSQVDLLVEVEEHEPYFFELGGGYESSKEFYARVKAGDHNLFGTNRYAWLGGEISQIGYRADMGMSEPRFLGSRIAASMNMFTERTEDFNQNFGSKTIGASLGFTRRKFKSMTFGLNFRLEQKDQYRLSDSLSSEYLLTEEEEEYEKRTILAITPSLIYNTRDSFIRPTKGVLSSLHVDISKGLKNSYDDFIKYRYDLRYYYTPVQRLTLAALGRAGYLTAYGDKGRIPQDQLFFLGGTSDVRGFEENLLRFDEKGDGVGGELSVSGSLEARFDLGADIELTAFYDVGSIQRASVDAGSDAFRSSAGLGLRYITPIGPIGILYGHKLDRKKGESAGRFHFSVGYTF